MIGISPRIGVRPFVALVIVLALGIAAQARATTVVDLGGFVPLGLNSTDQVVGDLVDSNANNLGAALWSNGILTTLPEPAGTDESDASAINDGGRIVGLDHTTSGDVHALFWNGTVGPTQIPPIASFGPGSDFSQANGVDAAGDVAGTTVGPSQTQFQLTGFLDKAGSISTVGRADAGANGSSSVGAITADGSLMLGSVAGTYFLWSGASPNAPGIPLNLTPSRSGAILFGTTIYGGLIENALASDGTVLGYIDNGSIRTYYIRLKNGTEIPTAGLAGNNAVNAKHVVAGTVLTGNPADPIHAGIWNPNGTVTDLNKLLPANSGFDLFDAFAINDNGDIAGIALHNGQQVGFLFKPGIQAENVEITQGIQQDSWDTPTTVNVPGYRTVNGSAYTGVPLVQDVPTVVRVYASDPTGKPEPPQGVGAELHAYVGASGSLSEVHGSPITASPRTLGAGFALPQARLDPTGAYTFTLPASWTKMGPLTLVADVNPQAGTPPACSSCTNVYALTGVDFRPTQPVTIRPLEIMYKYPNPGGGFTTVHAPDEASLFRPARDLLPLAAGELIIQPYPQAVLDISTQVQAIVSRWRTRFHTPLSKPDLTDCEKLPGCAGALLAAEYSAINESITLAHSGHTYLAAYEPGHAGSTWPALGFTILGIDHPPRPLTSVTHELLHLLGFEHASAACGGGTGGQIGVPWPPDELGYIEGVGLDRRPNSGGPGVYRIIAPGVGQPQWYDLMSYCTRGNDAVAWLSTVNWTKFVVDHDAADLASDSAATRATSAAAGRIVVDASLQPGASATILGVSSTTAAPTRSVSSPFHIKVLGSRGRVIANVGVALERVTESPVLMFTANVPGAGATTVELTISGHVMATLHRPAPLPSVMLIIPRGGLKASHHKLTIHWRARGARHVTLTAAIQYLASARLGYQTLAAGISGGSYTVPISMFAHATRVRIRVVIGDGFSNATATTRVVNLPRH